MNGITVQPSVMMRVVRRTLTVSSEQHAQILDITAHVQGQVTAADIMDGMVVANSLHTTCCLLVTEFHPALIKNLVAMLERLMPGDLKYKHNDPRYSDCERGNGTAHLWASLLNQTVAIGIERGRLLLGDRQSIVFAEWDGPRRRRIDLHMVGV